MVRCERHEPRIREGFVPIQVESPPTAPRQFAPGAFSLRTQRCVRVAVQLAPNLLKTAFSTPTKYFFSLPELFRLLCFLPAPDLFPPFCFLMKDAIVESFCRGHYSTGCRLPSSPSNTTASPRQRESVNHPTNTSRGIVETNLLMWEKAMFSRG